MECESNSKSDAVMQEKRMVNRKRRLRFFWHNAKASKLLSTNALITKWNFYGWEKQLGKMWKECDQASPQNLLLYTQCLKITHLSRLNLSIMAFFTNFCLRVTLFDRKLQFFSKIPQNWPFFDFWMNFCILKWKRSSLRSQSSMRLYLWFSYPMIQCWNLLEKTS